MIDRRLWLVLALWALAAFAAAALGLVSPSRIAVVPIAIASLVSTLVLAYRLAPAVRAFADGIDLRIPILFHVVRAPIGIAFLLMPSLDPVFAQRAGWGDIAAGVLAIGAALACPPTTRPRRVVVHAWNAIALADIVLVVGTAQSILFFSGHPETMYVLAGLPGALLPLFVVPLVIATHLLVLVRLRRAHRDS